MIKKDNVNQELKQDWKQRTTLGGTEPKSATPPPVYNDLLPLGMPSSYAVPLLAQPFFKIDTASPSLGFYPLLRKIRVGEICREQRLYSYYRRNGTP